MQGERDVGASDVNGPVKSPGYGGISEGTVGEPGATERPATQQDDKSPKPPEGRDEAPGEPGEGAPPEADTDPAKAVPADPPGSPAIPGLLDPNQPARRESSAEHRSSWPDEGGTGEAGTG
jgi:hypothetical protein